MNKIKLSYSTMFSTLSEPHTFINRQLGLKTFSSPAMEEGKAVHNIIQKHISGKELHPQLTLKNLPNFSIVEEKDWDERLKVTFEINDKYDFHGWIDAHEPERKEFLEIKSSGTPWSPSKFAQLLQWKCYALGLPEYTKIWLINTPRNPDLWNNDTIKVYNSEISPHHKLEAQEFIQKAIYTIENIKEAVNEAEKVRKAKYAGRSRWCYYQGCEFCKSD